MSGPNRLWEGLFGFLVVLTTALVVISLLGFTSVNSIDEAFTFSPDVPNIASFTPPSKDGEVRVKGQSFDTLSAALKTAESGDTLYLRGQFDGPITVQQSGLTLRGPSVDNPALIEGDGEGNVLTVTGDHTTFQNLWIRSSGYDPGSNDSGLWLNADDVSVLQSRITDITFGIWMDGVNGVRIVDNIIVGRESVYPLSSRGNGIQVWKSNDSLIEGNYITDVRDGIYYSWASEVLARNNTLWDMRYGVHYMYSDNCSLRENLAFNSDSGYALMVSKKLKLVGNTAVKNRGESGHGILLKSIDETILKRNTVVRNGNGFYVYNSLDNRFVENLVLENKIGVHLTAGSVRETVHHNSFIANGESVRASIGEQVHWSSDGGGNFWSDAHTSDVDGDGRSEIRHRPAGLLEQLGARKPLTRLFSSSPAFALIRLAESSVPIIESVGVVDSDPLVRPSRPDWRQYYE